MNAAHFAMLVSVETRKLFTRTSARIGLVIAVLIGIGVPLVRGLFRFLELRLAAESGFDPAELGTIDPSDWVFWALAVRNFWIFRVLLIVVAALVFAGEYQSRALREDLLRPVPRWSVLIAKWLALAAWTATTIVLTFVPAALVGIVAWGFHGEAWKDVALGYLATLATDMGFAALVLAVAVATRSVPGTIAGMVVFYFMESSLWIALKVIQYLPADMPGLPPVARDAAEQVVPWLPSAAFGVWTGSYDTVPWSWQGFTSLGVITALSLLVAERLLARLDVP
jgi:ABC-type transport system involved in multi-copper enzyme maturation permease subunit